MGFNDYNSRKRKGQSDEIKFQRPGPTNKDPNRPGMTQHIDTLPKHLWRVMNRHDVESDKLALQRDVFAMIVADAEAEVDGSKLAELAAPMTEKLREVIKKQFGDEYVSMYAAAESARAAGKLVFEKAYDLLKEQEKHEQKKKDDESKAEREDDGSGSAIQAQKAAQKASDEQLSASISDQQRKAVSSCSSAMGKAKRLAEKKEDMLEGGGVGKGDSTPELSQTEMRHLANLPMSNRLQQMMDLVGKADKMIVDNDAPEWVDGTDQPVGVKRVDSFDDLLTDQLGGMNNKTLRLATFLAVAEGEALGFRRVSELPRGMGPALVLVDTSGSMSGGRLDLACSITFSVCRELTSQGRDWAVYSFSDNTKHIKTGNNREDIAELLSKLTRMKVGGGTRINRALNIAQEKVHALGEEAGILLLTDSTDDITTSNRSWGGDEPVNVDALNDIGLVTISIGNSAKMQGLAAISKEYKMVYGHDLEGAAEAASTITHSQGKKDVS